ncbi:MAG: hypothetical protein ABIO72_02495 [Patescibacteria group bacterium]
MPFPPSPPKDCSSPHVATPPGPPFTLIADVHPTVPTTPGTDASSAVIGVVPEAPVLPLAAMIVDRAIVRPVFCAMIVIDEPPSAVAATAATSTESRVTLPAPHVTAAASTSPSIFG